MPRTSPSSGADTPVQWESSRGDRSLHRVRAEEAVHQAHRIGADLGVSSEVQQTITSVDPVPARAAGEIVEDDGEGHLRIVAALEQTKVV